MSEAPKVENAATKRDGFDAVHLSPEAADRIEALEAKLAKVVEAVRWRRDQLRDRGYTLAHAIACGILAELLAEIEGDKK